MFTVDAREIEDFAERMTALAELPYVDASLMPGAGPSDASEAELAVAGDAAPARGVLASALWRVTGWTA